MASGRSNCYSHNGFDYVSQGQTETRRITNVNQNVITLDKPFKSIQHLSVTRVISGTTSVTMIAEAEVGLAYTKYSLSWLSFNVYTLKSFKTFKCSSIGRQKDLAHMLRGIHFI